jgi:hypothetical protein
LDQNRKRVLLWGLSAIFLAVTGCGDNDTKPTVPDPGPEPEYILPSTPDSLIQVYRNAYELRQSASIDSLLAPGFTFTLAESEIDTFGIDTRWGRAAEVESVRRIFEGFEGSWPDGSVHEAVNGFPFNCSITPIEGSEWVFNEGEATYSREYQVSMLVTLVDFQAHFIGGTNLFVVADIGPTGGPNGEVATGFAIVRWEDLGFSDPGRSERVAPLRTNLHLSTWGFLKEIFREPGGNPLPSGPEAWRPR